MHTDLAHAFMMHTDLAHTFMMHTDRSVLRTLALLRSFVIRPTGLLTHDLAAPELMLFHVNMKRMTSVAWCITCDNLR